MSASENMNMEKETPSEEFFLGAAVWMTRDNFKHLRHHHGRFMKNSKLTPSTFDSNVKLTGSAAAICALYNLVKGTIAEENGASAEGSPPDQTPEEGGQRNTMEQGSQAERTGYPTDDKAKKTSTFTMNANGADGKSGQKERHPAANRSGQENNQKTLRISGTRTTAGEEPHGPQLPENQLGSSEKTSRSNSHNPSEVRESATWADRNDFHHGDATRAPRPANRHDLREGDAAQQVALEITDIEERAEGYHGNYAGKSENKYVEPITAGRNLNDTKSSRKEQDVDNEGQIVGPTKPTTDKLPEVENKNPTSGARAKRRERIETDSDTKSAMVPKDEKRVRKLQKNEGGHSHKDQPHHPSKDSPRSRDTTTATGHEQNKVLSQEHVGPSASMEESRSEVLTVTMETFIWMWIKGKYHKELERRKKQCGVLGIKEELFDNNKIKIHVYFPPDTNNTILGLFKQELKSLQGTAEFKGLTGIRLPPGYDGRDIEMTDSILVMGDNGIYFIVGPDGAEIEEIKTVVDIKMSTDKSVAETGASVEASASKDDDVGTMFLAKDVWGYLTLPNKDYIQNYKKKHKIESLTDDMKGDFIEIKFNCPKENRKAASDELSKVTNKLTQSLRQETVNLNKCIKKKEYFTQKKRLEQLFPDVYIYRDDRDIVHLAGTGEDIYQAKLFLMKSLGARIRKIVKETEPERSRISASSVQTPTATVTDSSYKTTNGQKIHIFQGDITKLHVDAIVNAGNERLLHGGGVAEAISKAAGPKLQQTCKDIMRGRKDLDVSEVIITDAYDLPCKFVIHAVGPRWRDYKQHNKETCMFDLKMAFINALIEASRYMFTSVAIPAISSGIYGVPLEVVVEQMYNAVIEFTGRSKSNDFLRDIILTDISSSTVSTIQRKFYHEVKVTQTVPLETIAPETYKFLGRSATVTPPITLREGGATPKHPRSNGGTIPVMSPITSHEGGAITKQPKTYSGAVKGGTQPRSSQGFSQTSEVKDLTRGSESRSDRGHKGHTGKEAWTDEPAASTGGQGQIGAYGGAVGQSQGQVQGQASGQEEVTCSICMDAVTEPKTLACKHTFCKECIDAWFQNKPTCPQCGKVYGKLTGNQPKGTMEDKIIGEPLPGYKCPTIEINYSFPSGRQGPEHPNPGKRYQGTRRTAYLPNNKPGKEVLRMLKEAFDARLTFTIGRSTTTGAEDQITWNDIHHKTHMTGGPERFGYPDKTYLERVKSELADKGIK